MALVTPDPGDMIIATCAGIPDAGMLPQSLLGAASVLPSSDMGLSFCNSAYQTCARGDAAFHTSSCCLLRQGRWQVSAMLA